MRPFLRVNAWDGVEWFHRESWDELVEWAQRLERVVTPSAERATRPVERSVVYRRLLEAGDASGYRLDGLRAALAEPAAAQPAAHGAAGGRRRRAAGDEAGPAEATGAERPARAPRLPKATGLPKGPLDPRPHARRAAGRRAAGRRAAGRAGPTSRPLLDAKVTKAPKAPKEPQAQAKKGKGKGKGKGGKTKDKKPPEGLTGGRLPVAYRHRQPASGGGRRRQADGLPVQAAGLARVGCGSGVQRGTSAPRIRMGAGPRLDRESGDGRVRVETLDCRSSPDARGRGRGGGTTGSAAYASPSMIRRRIEIGGAPWEITASRWARSSKPGVAG